MIDMLGQRLLHCCVNLIDTFLKVELLAQRVRIFQFKLWLSDCFSQVYIQAYVLSAEDSRAWLRPLRKGLLSCLPLAVHSSDSIKDYVNIAFPPLSCFRPVALITGYWGRGHACSSSSETPNMSSEMSPHFIEISDAKRKWDLSKDYQEQREKPRANKGVSQNVNDKWRS